jgi:hypothetical protein
MQLSLSKALRKRARIVRSTPRLQLEPLERRDLMAGLVQAADMQYLGAFKVPHGDLGASTFEYGGTAVAFNPKNNSLFVVGHDWDQAIAEIAIPAVKTGPLDSLSTGPMLQPFTRVLNRTPQNPLEYGGKVGGLMLHGDKLVGTAFEYYDADMNATASHFTLSSQNLASAEIDGLFEVGDLGGGFVGGYMAPVPAEWQSALGATHVTGQAGIPIISRTSAGPAIFGFDPNQLGPQRSPAASLVHYPLSTPLADVESQNPYFNTTTEITGVAFPEGTDSVLFVGSHGTGPWWYGEPTEGDFHDPYRADKGPHAPDYVYQVWAYNANDLKAVRDGEMQPWQVRPYDVWQLDLPYPEGSKHIGGMAYDPATNRLYVSQQYGNQMYPVIHVYQVGIPSGDATTPPPSTESPTLPPPIVEPPPVLNQAPLLDPNVTPALVSIAEDNRNSYGTQVWTLTSGITDSDAGALRGIAVVGADATNGSWQFTLDDGATWRWLGGVTHAKARLLPSDAMHSRLRFVPFQDFNGTAEISYFAWDQTQGAAGGVFDISSVASLGGSTAFSMVGRAGALRVTPVNDAPLLDPTVDAPFNPIPEDSRTSYGTPVWLLAAGIKDVDAGAQRGLAITSAQTGNGSWQYTLNGGVTWHGLGLVSSSSARLLPADCNNSRLRFVPNQDFHGTALVGYYAWDQTQGTPGGTFNISQASSRGGTTAFSAHWRTSTITVTPVNDAPVIANASGSVGYKLNASPIVLASSAAVSDVDSPHFAGGYLLLRIVSGADAGNRLTVGGTFSLQRVDNVVRVMQGSTHVGNVASDGFGTRNLRINFTSNATPAVVQQLLRSITFRTVDSTSTAQRMVAITLNDGQVDGTSVEVRRTVKVNR